jgi:thermitase
VNLSWTGANAPAVDIFRNDALLVQGMGNTGSYTDYLPINQRRTTYTYKVCEAFTSICSNEATVTFRR